MQRMFAIVLLFTAICGNVACSHRRQLQEEESLRDALLLLRNEANQFTLDHQRTPTSLSELVSSGYIKQIPTDPFTGRSDTWRVEKSEGSFRVFSGSDAISSKGAPYSSW
jgi:general secretion pathway protein G